MKKTTLLLPLLLSLNITLRASEITDLGDLGGTFTYPIAINDNGQITLIAATTIGESHLALYDHGVVTDLNEYYGLNINTFIGGGLNNRGDIACTVHMDYYDQAAILSHGEINLLPLPSTYYPSEINNRGEIIGGLWTGSNLRGFIYSKSGLLVQPFASGVSGFGGINNRGTVCGAYAEHWGDYPHSFIREPSGTLIWLTAGFSTATAINDREEVTGTLYGIQGDLGPGFIYRNGQLTIFGTDAWYTIPSAINNHGVVVGRRYYREIEEDRAFKYENGIISDIISPNPDWQLYDATGINNSGEIIGTYRVGNQTRAFLLRP